MKCIECGHELKDGAIFCIRCGAMQVSMDGSPLEKSAAAGAGAAGDQGMRPSVAGQHGREFQTGPQHNGGRIAAIIALLIVVAALIAFLAYSFMGPATSGTESSSAASSTATTSSEASSSAASTSSASASSTSASSASASASAASASAAAGASAAAAAATQQDNSGDTSIVQQEQQRNVVYEQAPAQAQQVGTQTSNAPAPSGGDYVLSDSSSRYYSQAELESMSTSDLYYARNEIYARHGRMFQRSDLQSYFDSKSWYTGTYTPAQFDSLGNVLNDCELKNVTLMKQVEAAKGSPYL